MIRGPQGNFLQSNESGEVVSPFIPSPLPPQPAIEWTPSLRRNYEDALVSLGKLDSAGQLLPDPDRFVYSYVRKEAVLSSQIEGTQSTLAELLEYENSDRARGVSGDVQEASRYVSALNHGLKRLADGFPLSLRLIREMHEILVADGRDSAGGTPGEFRRSQNWFGGTRPGNANFVPPPPHEVMPAMGALEKFLHDDPEPTPPLLKAALAHVQFETIHPFLDGNGRLGRMLVTLILTEQGVLSKPLLYLSLYLKEHRSDYYDLLNSVRHEGNWEDWLEFFARGVMVTAEQAVKTVKAMDARLKTDREKLRSIGRLSGSAERVLMKMAKRPISNVLNLAVAAELNHVTVRKCLTALERLGIAHEVTGGRRNKAYEYTEYLKMLNRGISS